MRIFRMERPAQYAGRPIFRERDKTIDPTGGPQGGRILINPNRIVALILFMQVKCGVIGAMVG